MTAELGTLTEVADLRRVWPHEALDFTPWLADNLDLLSDAIGVDLQLAETEADIGDFRADLLATETGTNRTVIIENQLEDTNHDHLGKLITYAAGKSAAIVVWMVKGAREEHRAAIEWLNGHTDEGISFFLCEVKLYTIDSSRPAVKFEVIEKPNDWAKIQKEATDGKKKARYDYWMAFNDHAFKDKTFAKEFHRRQPRDYWLNLSIGSSSCVLTLSAMRHKKQAISVSLYIFDSKELFDKLEADKEQLELAMGLPLAWMRNPDQKTSRIVTETTADISDRTAWPEQFKWLMHAALKFRQIFTSRI